jgi:outer membrane biosynthesis protein TonB
LKFTHLLAAAVCAIPLAGAAHAEKDYHGFKPETVDALNEKLQTPLTESALEVLSHSTEIEPCGGTQAITMNPPDGWEARLETSHAAGGDQVLPVPTTGLTLEYPAVYQLLGVEGACEAMFDITAGGKTENIQTSCSLPGFDEAAANVFAPLEFEPAEGQDSPAINNVLVPVNFCRTEEDKAAAP